jgi:hypothetical protein
MNLEFHYYATAALALRAGYPTDSAHLIARAAEHIDQALIVYEIADFESDGGRHYRTEKTQDYLFWDESVSRQIYLPFHFLPGIPERAALERADGQWNPWIVTPDSPLARDLLVAALRTGNLHRIGIALHAYADTWAHQNFTGRLESTNALDARSPLPATGHLQALTAPDVATEVWEDPRLIRPMIENRERFLAAASMIYRYLRTSLRRDFEDEVLVIGELGEMWERRDLDDRARAWDFSIRYDIEPWNPQLWLYEAGVSNRQDSDDRPRGYDKLRWLRAEIERRSGRGEGERRVDSGGRFADSALRAWSEAALAHRRLALELIDRRLGTANPGGSLRGLEK